MTGCRGPVDSCSTATYIAGITTLGAVTGRYNVVPTSTKRTLRPRTISKPLKSPSTSSNNRMMRVPVMLPVSSSPAPVASKMDNYYGSLRSPKSSLGDDSASAS